MNGNCQESSSKIRRGKETVVIWSLKKEERDGSEYLLESLPKCVVQLAGGEDGPKAKLRFYFEGKIVSDIEPPRPYLPLGLVKTKANRNRFQNDTTHISWIGLYAEQLFNGGGEILQYEIKVDRVDDQLNALPKGKGVVVVENFTAIVEAVKGSKTVRNLKVKEQFIELGDDYRKSNDFDSSSWYLAAYPEVPKLLLRLSVTPIYAHVADGQGSQNQGGAQAEAESLKEEASFCQALKGMFAAEENFSDLKLDTKDNMTLSAHKFILAARSPVLRARIEKAVKEEGFNGTIQLAEVNAKPMMAVLHWMYTCELHENAGKFMEEVVDAAIKFELTDLIKILDKKVISICTRENMFELYTTAEKNGMMTAVADVSKFIKENI